MTDDIAREHRQGSRDISIWRQRAEAAELEVERLTAALDAADEAPHGPGCNFHPGLGYTTPRACTCWRADYEALKGASL